MTLRAHQQYPFLHKGQLLTGEYHPIPDRWNGSRRLLLCSQAGSQARYWVEPENIFTTLQEVEDCITEQLAYWENQKLELASAYRLREELLNS